MGRFEGQGRKTKDGDDERFPIRVVRVRGTIDDHHTQVKPVCRPSGKCVRWRRAREQGHAGNDPHSDPFPQCPVGQNESAAISTFQFTCLVRLPALLRPVFVRSFTFVHKTVYCRARPYRPATPPSPVLVAINISTMTNNAISLPMSVLARAKTACTFASDDERATKIRAAR